MTQKEYILRVRFEPKFKVPVLIGHLYEKNDLENYDMNEIRDRLNKPRAKPFMGICDNCGKEALVTRFSIKKTRRRLYMCEECEKKIMGRC